TAGATTDTCLFDAWGNPVSSTGSTVNPFRWVGRSGYYTDSTTGLLYVRARMYAPNIARWGSVDPVSLSGYSVFLYCSNHPAQRIDHSGLLDCYCKGTCDFSGAGIQKNLNELINAELVRLVRGRFPDLQCPMGAAVADELRASVRNWFGSDVNDGYADPLPVTWIEQKLHMLFSGDSPDSVFPGKMLVGAFGIGLNSADCMPIKCNGSEFCLGTDKIGHFFQQGYMGFELGRAGFDDWVLAFFQMTEGLAVCPTPNGQKLIDGKYMHFSEWFNRTKFYFMGEGDVALQSYFRRWGGKLGGRTQSSTADVMANLAGKDFYDRLPDLCCCLKWYANNNTGPLPETQPCFDICGYVNALWEE
ncbi:MAG: RHS repeat-associated core domain-containing protein, partial [Planctomyces sp.]|nr:RHS repeat-associated core domain-containing protein [Planctomyces sp.]